MQVQRPFGVTQGPLGQGREDRKSTRLNSSHLVISYAVFCLKKKKKRLSSECWYCSAFLRIATTIFSYCRSTELVPTREMISANHNTRALTEYPPRQPHTYEA